MYYFVQFLTLVRIPLAILFSYILVTSENTVGVLFFCALLLLLCEISDFLDGFLARKFGITSELGAMLDPYSDSTTRLIVYWGLAASSMGLLILPLVMAIRDITVAYSRVTMSKSGVSVAALWSGKIKAGFQAVGAFALLLGPLYWSITGEWTIWAISALIILVTVVSGIEYVIKAVKITSAQH